MTHIQSIRFGKLKFEKKSAQLCPEFKKAVQSTIKNDTTGTLQSAIGMLDANNLDVFIRFKKKDDGTELANVKLRNHDREYSVGREKGATTKIAANNTDPEKYNDAAHELLCNAFALGVEELGLMGYAS